MKILIADKLSSQAVSDLEALGCQVTMNPDLGADDLPDAIGDAEALIVRSTKVTAKTMASANSLTLIIRAGAGVNTIDLDYASEHGINVANCPGKNADAVAELAIGLMLAADRRIVQASVDMRNGVWNKKEYGKAAGVKGRTLGIIGLGAIGQGVASRALGLEMNVIAWSRSLTPEKAAEMKIGYCATPEDVAVKADVISLHVAVKDETRHMINRDFLSRMKDGAILVNAARGEVVDTAALKEAIKTKNLRVGLDVYEDEPDSGKADFADTELAEMVACTPHIGASTDQAAEAIAAETVRIVKTYMETGHPENCVNLRGKATCDVSLVVRHYNRVGVLAGVLNELRNEGVNIEEMENAIFTGGRAACCTLRLDKSPAPDILEKLSQNSDIIQAVIK